MAKYTVLETSYIHNAIVEAGTVIEFDGEPGPNLAPHKRSRRAAEGEASEGEPAAESETPPLA